MLITENDVSFVIQGACNSRWTRNLANSIRTRWPYAEIVQSTNCAQSPSGPCDIFVQVDDPGELDDDNNRNLNRQIATSTQGIEAATRPFVVKVRDDLLFTKDFDLNTLFQPNKIGVLEVFTLNPITEFVFHPSDWLWAGSKELVKLYASPEFKTEVRNASGRLHRCEQYFFLNYLKKQGHGYTISNENDGTNRHSTIYCFVHYLHIISMFTYGIISQKHQIFPEALNIMVTSELLESWKHLQNDTL